MKQFKYIITGILFGIIMTKSEVISWLRIYEMFKFKSFHMYGVIGSAVAVGIILVQIIKRTKMKSTEGIQIEIHNKQKSYPRVVFGGLIFGIGWALTGACPGPMAVLIGNGFLVFSVVILSATLGTFVYGLIKNKLPH
jgi:hypothetical protein